MGFRICLIPKSKDNLIVLRDCFNQFVIIDLMLTTGVLPVLSTETILHIWLSTENSGFRPSCTVVDTRHKCSV